MTASAQDPKKAPEKSLKTPQVDVSSKCETHDLQGTI